MVSACMLGKMEGTPFEHAAHHVARVLKGVRCPRRRAGPAPGAAAAAAAVAAAAAAVTAAAAAAATAAATAAAGVGTPRRGFIGTEGRCERDGDGKLAQLGAERAREPLHSELVREASHGRGSWRRRAEHHHAPVRLPLHGEYDGAYSPHAAQHRLGNARIGERSDRTCT